MDHGPTEAEEEETEVDHAHGTDVPVPVDWNAYQGGATDTDLLPGNRLVKTKKVPGKDYMRKQGNRPA